MKAKANKNIVELPSLKKPKFKQDKSTKQTLQKKTALLLSNNLSTDNAVTETKKKRKKENTLVKVEESAKKTKKVITKKTPGKARKNIGTTKKLDGFDIPHDTVEQAVKALFLLRKAKEAEKKALLGDSGIIYLNVALMKQPIVERQRRRYLHLKHSIFGEDPEVCLFVEDKKKPGLRTPDEKIDNSIEHYENLLKTYGVKGISTIMPMFQLRTEYDSYELKRKLVDRFDIFLTQSTLLEKSDYLKNIGVAFTRKNKVPHTVRIPITSEKKEKCNVKEVVDKILKKTWFNIKLNTQNYAIKVGTVTQSEVQIQENIVCVLDQLESKINQEDALPGGPNNVKSIIINTTDNSPPVPLYMNLASRNTVEVPVVKNCVKNADVIEGELSTLPGKKVTVLPNGDVFVTNDEDEKLPPGWSDDEDLEEGFHDSSDEEMEKTVIDEDEVKVPQVSRKRKQVQKEAKQDDDSDASDVEAENAEEVYLRKLTNNAAEDAEETVAAEDAEGTVAVEVPKKKLKGSIKTKGNSLKQGKKKNSSDTKGKKPQKQMQAASKSDKVAKKEKSGKKSSKR